MSAKKFAIAQSTYCSDCQTNFSLDFIYIKISSRKVRMGGKFYSILKFPPCKISNMNIPEKHKGYTVRRTFLRMICPIFIFYHYFRCCLPKILSFIERPTCIFLSKSCPWHNFVPLLRNSNYLDFLKSIYHCAMLLTATNIRVNHINRLPINEVLYTVHNL